MANSNVSETRLDLDAFVTAMRSITRISAPYSSGRRLKACEHDRAAVTCLREFVDVHQISICPTAVFASLCFVVQNAPLMAVEYRTLGLTVRLVQHTDCASVAFGCGGFAPSTVELQACFDEHPQRFDGRVEADLVAAELVREQLLGFGAFTPCCTFGDHGLH
jgi:hypothetical protein